MILPPLTPSFAWRETPAGVALVCVPLEAIAPHLFTTRAWTLGRSHDGGPGAWAEIADAFGQPASPLLRMRQVHGSRVVPASGDAIQAAAAGAPLDGDIILAATGPDRIVAVQAADCVPILLADRRSGSVAAAHAGWKGLALRVPALAVQSLVRDAGARPFDLVAVCGPSIGACCYQVGADVRDAFLQGGFTAGQVSGWFHDSPPPAVDHVALAGSEQQADRWYFDGWRSAREQLVDAGVPRAQVFAAGLCTAGHAGVLCSYRRDGLAAGRMAAAIRTPR